MPHPHLVWLEHLSHVDTDTVGTKAATLGDMLKLGLPVPNGFAVTVAAYYTFLHSTGLRTKLEDVLVGLDIHDAEKLQKTAQSAQAMVRHASLPAELVKDITQAYHKLSAQDIFVAIRSSLIDGESPEIALSSQALLNVISANQVVEAVQELWAHLFSARAIYSRIERGESPLGSGLGVIVQKMIESEASGICFSIDPISGNDSVVSIEAVWGLGETIVSGALTPDHYEVDKQTWEITERTLVRQDWQLVRSTKHHPNLTETNLRLPISAAWQQKQKLSDKHIVALAKLVDRLESHFKVAQDCEWAFADHTVYLVQTRPVIQLSLPEIEAPQQIDTLDHHQTSLRQTPLLSGTAGSPGISSGPVRIITSKRDAAKVSPGEVLVFKSTTTQDDAALANASAIITDKDSLSSHSTIMAQQLGIPAVHGTTHATTMLTNGEMVTVDGIHGVIYQGQVHIHAEDLTVRSERGATTLAGPIGAGVMAETKPLPLRTATKILTTVTEPATAIETASKPTDGVGLLRAEYFLAHLGEHPQYLLKRGKSDTLVETLYEGIMQVAKAYAPRPVIYRLSTFTSQEYGRLHGAEKFESPETDPLLGYRGALRMIANPELLQLEIAAIKKARQYYKNIWLLLPFVRTPLELTQMKQLIAEEGLHRSGSFKLLLSIELPTHVFLLDQFIGVGIDGVTIQTRDLARLILGLDPDNPKVAESFDEHHPAVMTAVEQVIKGVAGHGLTSSIISQTMPLSADFVRQVVSWGISSISVPAETVELVQQLVAEAEYDLVRQR